jgi:hydroxymethylglutaryl-CoA lyase/(R)-citramalyl-CoA lyase
MAALTISEVGPRDGLQNESRVLSPEIRAQLIDRLAACGATRIEAVSFVNPRRVPAMADAELVLSSMQPTDGVSCAGLVLNQRGYDRALAAGIAEVHYAFPVTDTFARENQGTTTEAATALSQTLTERARRDGVRFTVTLSCSFGCPFEGRVPAARVLEVAEQVLQEPPDEIVIADTIGAGVPSQVRELVRGLRSLGAPVIGAHFHDTRNTGVANAVAALEAGVTVLDASIGGAGGCPFAPRATGNVATEDLVYTFGAMGVDTGLDLDRLIECTHWLEAQLGRDLPSRVSRAGTFPQ